MSNARPIISAMALSVALSVAAPPAALAGSLLSGYGGPGAGNQALIGVTLLNGPGGGGSGPSGRDGEAAGGQLTSSAAGEQSRGGSSSTGASASRGGDRAGDRARSQLQPGGSSASAARAYPTSSSAATADRGAIASATLGLSSDDLPYILLVLAGLALTIVITRRLTRATVTGGHRR